ncbi:MAG: GNAT family N-acetyltransferase [Thermoplasmata archaeon]|nr:GNAT family N-acetyltransferase [Thermoplasmata archaeon]
MTSPRNAAPPNPRLRRATLEDVDLLVAHRVAMFREMGGRSRAALARHGPEYLAWLVPRLVSAELVAFVAEDAKGVAMGTGAVWFRPSHPGPGSPARRSPYILSMYTVPAARGRGVATDIVNQVSALSRRLGYGRVGLHASAMGRGVYARMGFLPTTEMQFPLTATERRRMLRSRAAMEARRG